MNLYCRSQSAVCYHYTNSLYVACLSKLPFRTGAQVIPPHGALRAILADFEALLSHQALFCVGQDVSCTYGNWRPTLARTVGNRTQHTGFWRPRRHLGTFARIYALPTFQPERRGVRAATYGRQLIEEEELCVNQTRPCSIIIQPRGKGCQEFFAFIGKNPTYSSIEIPKAAASATSFLSVGERCPAS